MRAVLSFQAITATADASGDYSESAGTAVNVPGELVMHQGYKKMIYTELINKNVYQFDCYDNSVLTNGAKATWSTKTFNIHSVVRNFDGSFTNKVTIILYEI